MIMTARILVVDDLEPNLKLLEMRLNAEYFDVLTATNGPDALALCEAGKCDLVLLDVMMPDIDGFEVCRRLKANVETAHIPVVMVTALDQPTDRLRGLEAGADDFLTKPVDEVALIARVRNLVRLKSLTDELRSRASVSRDVGLADPHHALLSDNGMGGRILLVDDQESSSARLAAALGQTHTVEIESDPQKALMRAPEGDFDAMLVSLSLSGFDALRLCSQVRALERTKSLPILMIAGPEDKMRVVRGLEIGANDYLTRPVDRSEMLSRTRSLVRRKRYHEALSRTVSKSIEAAIVDPLTGLHNRRYMQSHLSNLVNGAAERGIDFAVMILDIDHFKMVNDTYGHDAGDEVIKEIAARIRKALRKTDMACRAGGEEFMVLMPETSAEIAVKAAERIRQRVEKNPFPIHGGRKAIRITASIGVSGYTGSVDTAESIMKRADEALYQAKREGRNKVVSAAA
jgi:two-component system, cell cycle response regulator